jgi:hypothetical protein
MPFHYVDILPREDQAMAKSQKKSNREIRKPKAEKPKSGSTKLPDKVPGLEHMKR